MTTLEGPVLPALRFDLRVAHDGSASLIAAPKRQPGERSAPGPYVQVRRGQGLRSGCTLGWDGSMLHDGRMGCVRGMAASMQHPGRPPQFEVDRRTRTWAHSKTGCWADLHAAVASPSHRRYTAPTAMHAMQGSCSVAHSNRGSSDKDRSACMTYDAARPAAVPQSLLLPTAPAVRHHTPLSCLSHSSNH